MIALLLGLSIANLMLLTGTFVLGLGAVDAADAPTDLYALHIILAIAAGLFAVLTHLAAYTYFMATCKWLAAAADRAALDPARHVAPALARKRRVFAFAMAAVTITMLTMFAGAGADPVLGRLWPSQVHLILALLTLVANALAALAELRHVQQQSRLIDHTLVTLAEHDVAMAAATAPLDFTSTHEPSAPADVTRT
jgi:hypothetical protein